MSVILNSCEPFQSTAEESGKRRRHHKLMDQTQHNFQIDFNKHCLQMTSKGEADRYYLFDIVLKRYLEWLAIPGQQAQLVPKYFHP